MLFSYFLPVFAIAQFNQQKVRNMAAKIQILDKQTNSFGGIFYVISQFRSSDQAALTDKKLGVKGINTKISYSNMVENLTSVFVSGGEMLENAHQFRHCAHTANTIGRDLRGLAVESTEFQTVTSGKTYQFNINGRLNDLLLDGLLKLGMVSPKQPVIFDYYFVTSKIVERKNDICCSYEKYLYYCNLN